jgi:hypothetical protein
MRSTRALLEFDRIGDPTLRVTDPNGELLAIVPWNSTGEISRFKAYGSRHSH